MQEISIIVPIYNGEKQLERCLESIKNQTYESFYAILVNDGSTDNSEKICKKYLMDSRFKYYYKNNGGLVDSLIFGIKHSTTKYTCFVDCDDFIGEDYLNNFIRNFEENIDVLACGFYYYNNGEKIPYCLEPKTIDNFELLNRYIISENLSLDKSIFIARWNKMYKTSILIDNLNFIMDNRDTSLFEDSLFVGILLKNNARIKSLKIINSYFYDISNSSMTRSNFDIESYFIKQNKLINSTVIKKIDTPSHYIINAILYSLGNIYISSFVNSSDIESLSKILNDEIYIKARKYLSNNFHISIKNKIDNFIINRKKHKLYFFIHKIRAKRG